VLSLIIAVTTEKTEAYWII